MIIITLLQILICINFLTSSLNELSHFLLTIPITSNKRQLGYFHLNHLLTGRARILSVAKTLLVSHTIPVHKTAVRTILSLLHFTVLLDVWAHNCSCFAIWRLVIDFLAVTLACQSVISHVNLQHSPIVNLIAFDVETAGAQRESSFDINASRIYRVVYLLLVSSGASFIAILNEKIVLLALALGDEPPVHAAAHLLIFLTAFLQCWLVIHKVFYVLAAFVFSVKHVIGVFIVDSVKVDIFQNC